MEANSKQEVTVLPPSKEEELTIVVPSKKIQINSIQHELAAPLLDEANYHRVTAIKIEGNSYSL